VKTKRGRSSSAQDDERPQQKEMPTMIPTPCRCGNRKPPPLSPDELCGHLAAWWRDVARRYDSPESRRIVNATIASLVTRLARRRREEV
jgi:hypothetical protein